MGKKYIIEIPEDKIADFVGSTHFLMPYMMAGHIGHHDTGLPIKPYTEPDLEQVRKEAYEAGMNSNAVKMADDKSHESYQRGLADAWEAVGKIYNMCSDVRHKIFKENLIQKILSDYTATEAIEKLKTYEQEHEQKEIKVGDEVKTEDGMKMVIAALIDKDFAGLGDDGRFMFGELDGTITRTGRHFPEIATVLKKMRGEKE